ncbi:cell division topological specificity factor MinE [Candidatus Pantoea edessiphila]|uniref:Cell division topological specificity factor n=1 Tax=Candidatus Pantoea edessiphila TaxID=2044610 RepID=A0A2P5T2Q5_9GAMM|nr:cell division topological specificity factor MinE [Candidatus Pantoea edessiphila]PPI88843.1 cell division topological specificity factor MinE [Candidatus Pantoea edessiphila]
MSLINFFLPKKKYTASIAKERLQIIVAERRKNSSINNMMHLQDLKKDILEIVCRYVQIDPKTVIITLDKKENDISILELNVTIPDTKK